MPTFQCVQCSYPYLVCETHRENRMLLCPKQRRGRRVPLAFHLGRNVSTVELSILQARKEINLFVHRTHKMFGMVHNMDIIGECEKLGD